SFVLALTAGCQMFPAAPDAQAVTEVPALTPTEPQVPALRVVRGPEIVVVVSDARDGDLIERVRRQLSLPESDDDSVRAQLRWYASHPDYLERVFKRGEPYLPHIVEELERRGMPLDLALLPIVESAFDPFAYSHGRAAGLWQIIPGTGKRL